MFLLELTTKSGALYTANVITKKIRRIGPSDAPDKKPEWLAYQELRGGNVGEKLVVLWDDNGGITHTTEVVGVTFPEVE